MTGNRQGTESFDAEEALRSFSIMMQKQLTMRRHGGPPEYFLAENRDGSTEWIEPLVPIYVPGGAD